LRRRASQVIEPPPFALYEAQRALEFAAQIRRVLGDSGLKRIEQPCQFFGATLSVPANKPKSSRVIVDLAQVSLHLPQRIQARFQARPIAGAEELEGVAEALGPESKLVEGFRGGLAGSQFPARLQILGSQTWKNQLGILQRALRSFPERLLLLRHDLRA